jgi:hypothetical protein
MSKILTTFLLTIMVVIIVLEIAPFGTVQKQRNTVRLFPDNPMFRQHMMGTPHNFGKHPIQNFKNEKPVFKVEQGGFIVKDTHFKVEKANFTVKDIDNIKVNNPGFNIR